MILKEYINRDIYRTATAILLVLILIFVTTRFVKYIQLAVEGTISANAVFSLLALQIPAVAGFLLPLSFFLSILLTFGRLYSDNELVVVHGLGLGQWDLAKMLMPLALIFAMVAGGLSTMLTPWANAQSKLLMAEQAAKAKLGVFSAGRFRENNNKDGIVFVESKSNDGVISGVFSVSRRLSADGSESVLRIQTAKQGRQWEDQNTGVNYLVLEQGQFFELSLSTDSGLMEVNVSTKDTVSVEDFVQVEPVKSKRSSTNDDVQNVITSPSNLLELKRDGWQITDFGSSYTKIVQEQFLPIKYNTKSASTFELIRNLDNDNWAALHWRLGAPLSIPLICLLAVPLARTRPRQGKLGRLLPSTMIYLIYVLVMMYSRKLIESGAIPGALGFWWIHGTLLLFIYWLYRPINSMRAKRARENKFSRVNDGV